MKAEQPHTLFGATFDLAAGLIVGLTSMSSGYAIGVLGDSGVRAMPKQPRLFVGLALILVFAEMLGLFGLLLGILTHAKASQYAYCT